MRVNLAVHASSEEVANQMEQKENEATKSTHTYIKKSCLLFNNFDSETPINSDRRINQRVAIRYWFSKWENYLENKFIMLSEIPKHHSSSQKRKDVHSLI